MGRYMPIRGSQTAIPDALRAIRREVSDLASVTAGQVGATSQQVQAPPLMVLHGFADSWRASNGQTVVSVSAVAPPGSSTVHVLVSVSGQIESVAAPSMRISAAQETSNLVQVLPSQPGMWFMAGSAALSSAVQPQQTITIALTVGQVDTPLNGHAASLDVMAAFI